MSDPNQSVTVIGVVKSLNRIEKALQDNAQQLGAVDAGPQLVNAIGGVQQTLRIGVELLARLVVAVERLGDIAERDSRRGT